MNNPCKSCEHGGVCTDKHDGNSLPVKEEAVDVACSGSSPAKKRPGICISMLVYG